jgi:hypothetical protein
MGEKYLITMSLMFLTLVPLILLKVLFKFLQKLMQYELKLRPLKSEKIQVLLESFQVSSPPELERQMQALHMQNLPQDLKPQTVMVLIQWANPMQWQRANLLHHHWTSHIRPRPPVEDIRSLILPSAQLVKLLLDG